MTFRQLMALLIIACLTALAATFLTRPVRSEEPNDPNCYSQAELERGLYTIMTHHELLLTTIGPRPHYPRMDKRPRLNLENVSSPRERELLDLVRDTEFERILRGEVDLASATGGQKVVGDRAPIAQDAFSAILFRQGGLAQGS